MPIHADPKTIRVSLLAEIEAADRLGPVAAEALRRAFVPFAEYFAEVQSSGRPTAGAELADATAAVAAAIVGHLQLNASHRTLDCETALEIFMADVLRRVRWSLAAEGVGLKDDGRRH